MQSLALAVLAADKSPSVIEHVHAHPAGERAPTPDVGQDPTAQQLDDRIELLTARVEYLMGKAKDCLTCEDALFYYAEANRADITLSALRLQRGKA